MEGWKVEYSAGAAEDMKGLDRSSQAEVLKAIRKVSLNPLPNTEGGYGKPLGNKASSSLHGLLKIVLRRRGIRVVYRLKKVEGSMRIIIIAARKDDYVYKQVEKRMKKGEGA